MCDLHPGPGIRLLLAGHLRGAYLHHLRSPQRDVSQLHPPAHLRHPRHLVPPWAQRQGVRDCQQWIRPESDSVLAHPVSPRQSTKYSSRNWTKFNCCLFHWPGCAEQCSPSSSLHVSNLHGRVYRWGLFGSRKTFREERGGCHIEATSFKCFEIFQGGNTDKTRFLLALGCEVLLSDDCRQHFISLENFQLYQECRW